MGIYVIIISPTIIIIIVIIIFCFRATKPGKLIGVG